MYDKVFLTGSDKNNEWMLKWWLDNYKNHNSLPVLFADFGVSSKMRKWAESNFDKVLDMPEVNNTAWFLKPYSMIEASKGCKKVCWIDTDCHILQPIEDIFNYVVPQRLSMVRDRPWTKRFNQTWHNSGVVAFEGLPHVLSLWEELCRTNSEQRGDQEVLHAMMNNDELRRRTFIEDIPSYYNWLRLDIKDGRDSNRKKIMHWTGRKGKEVIKEMMKND